jgi:tetratricopeptide (TPR) repeat protein/tRNA A-37 threonylcarbamoyl transferase component Bud32
MPLDSLRVQEVFLAVVEADDPEARDQLLDLECGADTELRKRVLTLLSAHDAPDSFLDATCNPIAEVVPPGIDELPAEAPGAMIGRYQLIEKLGEGGMGTVWAAEQTEPVIRRVALKLIKAGMDSNQVLRRFEHERQALARMNHTNIAKVFDAGVGEFPPGRPFFVMELVQGEPITGYCRQRRLPLAVRLRMFVSVCQAIQHAHAKGIIHRDIKPSNVLVAEEDSAPVPKVIDFGVAKALDVAADEAAVDTVVGQIVGTFEYMSPEQAELGAREVDTRSDIYALGVLLYELLTGVTPLDRAQFKQAGGLSEVMRQIREVEPPRPSLRLARMTSPAASEVRPTHGVRWHELDWITMKALEKDRGRRYESAAALARDVQRHLDDEPVEACPPTLVYRCGKFLRRHKGPVATAGLLFAALVAGVAGTSWGMMRAERAAASEAKQRSIAEAERQQALAAAQQERQARERESQQRRMAEIHEDMAQDEKQVAQAVMSFLVNDLLRQAGPKHQANALRRSRRPERSERNPTILELLTRAADELSPEAIEAKFPGQAKAQGTILRALGETYLAIGRFRPAVELLRRAVDTFVRDVGNDHPYTWAAMKSLGQALFGAGENREAIELFEQVRDAQSNRFGPDDARTLSTSEDLASAYQAAGRLGKAIEIFEHARDAQKKESGDDNLDALGTMNNLAVAYGDEGRFREAAELLERVAGKLDELLGPNHPDTLLTLNNLAGAYRAVERLPDAIELLTCVRNAEIETLGAEHPHTLLTSNNLAEAWQAVGKLDEAIDLYDQVQAARSRVLGPEHPDTLVTLNNLAAALQRKGELTRAIEIHERMRDVRMRHLGPNHPNTLLTLNNLATAYQAAKQLPQAIELLEHVRGALERLVGAGHPQTILATSNLAAAYHAAGNADDALRFFRQAATSLEQRNFEYPNSMLLVGNLCDCLEEQRLFTEAEPWRRKSLELAKQRFGANDPLVVSKLAAVGMNLLGQARYSDAEEVLRESLALCDRWASDAKHAVPDWLIGQVKSLLGEALARQSQLSQAEPLLLEGFAGLKENEAAIGTNAKLRVVQAVRRLVGFYAATDQPAKADEWRARLPAETPPP